MPSRSCFSVKRSSRQLRSKRSRWSSRRKNAPSHTATTSYVTSDRENPTSRTETVASSIGTYSPADVCRTTVESRPGGYGVRLGQLAHAGAAPRRCGTTCVRYSSSHRSLQKRSSVPSTSATQSCLATTCPQQSHGVITVSQTSVSIDSQWPTGYPPLQP